MTATVDQKGLIQFDHSAEDEPNIEFFEFGGSDFGMPQSAVDASDITDYLGVFLAEKDYYTPPVSPKGLIQLMRANPQHGALPSFAGNLLVKYMVPNRAIPRQVLKRAAVDLRSQGNCYFQAIRNRIGQVIELRHLPAINMRRRPRGLFCQLQTNGDVLNFNEGEVIQIIDYDPMQQIYGIPYWFGAVQSILLGEDSRLFPRRFFRNGAHTGNLVATSGLTVPEEKYLKSKLSSTKGIGNFRSMHIGMPNGDVDKVIKVIPIGEIGSKVEFHKLSNLSATDVLEAWRIRPELAGMMPENMTGSGDLGKIMEMHYEYEIIPFQQEFEQLNQHLPPRSHIKFKEWKRTDS